MQIKASHIAADIDKIKSKCNRLRVAVKNDEDEFVDCARRAEE